MGFLGIACGPTGWSQPTGLNKPCPSSTTATTTTMTTTLTILQERHTAREQINTDPLDAVLVATITFNLGLGPAREYTGYIPWWLVLSISLIITKASQNYWNCTNLGKCTYDVFFFLSAVLSVYK